MLSSRFLGFIPMVLGLVGVLACLWGGYAVWGLASEARQANEKLFDAATAGTVAAGSRVKNVAAEIQTARIVSEDFEAKLKSLSQKQARERIATELELERRADQIAAKFATADAWLEGTIESTRLVQKLLVLCQSAGARLDPTNIEELVTVLGEIRGDLQQANHRFQEIRDFGKPSEGESEANRVERVIRLLVKIVAMIVELDTRLNRVVDRLDTFQGQLPTWQHRADIAIQRCLAITLLLLAWMAAGQYSLFRFGLNRISRGVA